MGGLAVPAERGRGGPTSAEASSRMNIFYLRGWPKSPVQIVWKVGVIYKDCKRLGECLGAAQIMDFVSHLFVVICFLFLTTGLDGDFPCK